MPKALFRVVTKVALFNSDQTKVLVIHMDFNDDYGLPGGHINEGEELDEAMKRELYEECGVKSGMLRRVGFFTHSNGKIVLAYTGVATNDKIASQQDNLEGKPRWLSREEFESVTIEPNYRRLVLDHWN